MKLDIAGITFSYNSVTILDNLTFNVESGEILGVLGPNGSGKTTLLKCINSVLKPKIGTVLIDDTDIIKIDRKEIARNIGVVPQNATIHFPFRVLDIVLMGRTPYLGHLGRETAKDFEIAKKAMEYTNIQHLANRLITETSGGEKQRIIISRALTQEPKILLLDEPTLHLDVNHQLDLLELVKRLATENKLIVVLISHDINLASRYCNRLILLKSGKIQAIGKPEEVITPENMRQVYNVEVEINNNTSTKPFTVIPISTNKS